MFIGVYIYIYICIYICMYSRLPAPAPDDGVDRRHRHPRRPGQL